MHTSAWPVAVAGAALDMWCAVAGVLQAQRTWLVAVALNAALRVCAPDAAAADGLEAREVVRGDAAVVAAAVEPRA